MTDHDAARTPAWDFVGQPTRHGLIWAWLLVDLDLSTVARARTELTVRLFASDELGWVLIYIGTDRFVDLRGLRLLHDAAGEVRARRGELVVVAPPRCVRVLLTVSGAAVDLPVVETPGRAARLARSCRVRSQVRPRLAESGGRR